jgi:hypothetical protein
MGIVPNSKRDRKGGNVVRNRSFMTGCGSPVDIRLRSIARTVSTDAYHHHSGTHICPLLTLALTWYGEGMEPSADPTHQSFDAIEHIARLLVEQAEEALPSPASDRS